MVRLRLLEQGRHPTTKVIIDRHERVLVLSQLQILWPTVPGVVPQVGNDPAGDFVPGPGLPAQAHDPFGEFVDEDYESFLLGSEV
jgi:hypothetical protein